MAPPLTAGRYCEWLLWCYPQSRMVWYVLLVALSCSQAHGCFSQIFARKELNFERMGERDSK